MFQAAGAASPAPAHVRGLCGNSSRVWGGLCTETAPGLTSEGIITATQTAGLGAGMFQQKVLFAEHTEPSPAPSLRLLLFVCVSMAFRDHN